MMKSLDIDAQAVLLGCLKDFQAAYPKLSSLNRDGERLLSLMKNRGLSCFMIDLPNLDTILLNGLETGRLCAMGPLSTVVSKRVKVPRLFSGLWLRIFDREGDLRCTPDITAIAFIRQISCLFKNVQQECSLYRKSIAVKEYYDVEESLRHSTLLWADDEFDHFGSLHSVHFRDGLDCADDSVPSGRLSTIELLCDRLQRICDSVSGELGLYDPYVFTKDVGRVDEPRRFLSHGRGSVSDAPRGANKYAFPSWSDRLQRVYPYDAFGCYRFDNTLEFDRWKNTVPSKLIAVPKTLAKPRLIASEPTANQWCQQIMMRWLIQRMKETRLSWFLNINNQELSRSMVKQASSWSVQQTNIVTVDLSSASDRLSCWAIERFLRRNPPMLDALTASRSPILHDGITSRDEILLKKFASQGTATTFPIQSIFFLCCVLASLGCNSLRHAKKWRGLVRVYGDDIIMPYDGYENLKLLLPYLQLKINEGKSFVNGKFRESCGMDCYDGHNVTPVKPKTLSYRGPKSEQAILDSANNLFKAGYWHCAEALVQTTGIPVKRYPVVGPDSGVTGLASFCGAKVSHLKERWNSNLHRQEVRCRVTVNKATRRSHNDTSGIFQFFAENPSPLQSWKSGVDQEARLLTKPQWVDLNDVLVGRPCF